MMAIAHEPIASHPHATPRRAAAGEYPGIKEVIAGAAHERRMLGVQHHEVSQLAWCNAAGIAAQRLRPSRERPGIQVIDLVASSRFQASDIVQPAQLLDRA